MELTRLQWVINLLEQRLHAAATQMCFLWPVLDFKNEEISSSCCSTIGRPGTLDQAWQGDWSPAATDPGTGKATVQVTAVSFTPVSHSVCSLVSSLGLNAMSTQDPDTCLERKGQRPLSPNLTYLSPSREFASVRGVVL